MPVEKTHVAVPIHLVNAVVEQLDFHRDNVQEGEDRDLITELIGDLESATSDNGREQYKVIHESNWDVITKHMDMDEFFGE